MGREFDPGPVLATHDVKVLAGDSAQKMVLGRGVLARALEPDKARTYGPSYCTLTH